MSAVEPALPPTPSEPEPVPKDVPIAGWKVVGALPWLLIAVWAFVMRQRFPATNHDAAFLTVTAGRWLDGEVLYSGITQPNPPLVYWLHAVPVVVHRLTGFPLDQALRLWLVALVAWGCLLTAYTMRAVRVPATPGARHLATLVWVALVTVHTGYDFGQREDVVVSLIAPWMVAAAAAIAGRPVDRRLALVVAVTAFLGFGMKPFFPAVWGVVELWVLLRTRRLAGVLRRENVVLFGLLAVYAAYMVLCTDYVGDLRRWAVGYPPFGALGAPYNSVVRSAQLTWLAEVGAAWLVLRLVFRLDAIRPLDEVVALSTPVFSALFVAQGHGFTYQNVPANVLSWWLVALVGIGVAMRITPLRFTAWGVVGLAGWLAWKGGSDFRSWWHDDHEVWPSSYGCRAREELKQEKSDGNCRLRAVIKQVQQLTDPGDPVAWVTPTVLQSGFVAMYADVVDVVQKTPSLLPDLYPPSERFAKVFPYHPEGQRHELEELVLFGLADDVERTRPVLITFDVRTNLRGFGDKSRFDLVTFYLQDPRFAALLERDYVEVPDTSAEGTIRWFVRKDRAPAGGNG